MNKVIRYLMMIGLFCVFGNVIISIVLKNFFEAIAWFVAICWFPYKEVFSKDINEVEKK